MPKVPIRVGLVWVLSAVLLQSQQQPRVIPPPGFGPRPSSPVVTGDPAKQQQPQPAQPAPPQPAEQAKPAAPEPAPQTARVQETPTPSGGFVLNLQNASLTEVIDILARRLKINYILDPRVRGSVTINTYGEIKQVEVRPLLETILRVNGAAIVQVGELYRIVLVQDVARLPISPQVDPKKFADDERMMLNLIFLKYATVSELSKLLEPFLGEGAKMISFDPANLLLILDNSRNMARTMELISMFDSDTLAGQRVRLLEVKHSRPSDLTKELDSVMKAVTLADKSSAVKFLPLDRINTIVAIAPNPGVFEQVETWLKKLDVAVKAKAGSVDNYVYRVKYGRAETLAMAIMQLYGGYMGGYGMGMGGYGMGGYGMGGYGMGMGGYGMGMGMGGYGMGGYGMQGYGGGFGGYGGGFGMPPANTQFTPTYTPGPSPANPVIPVQGAPGSQSTGTSAPTAGAPDLTGSYLGGYGAQGYGAGARIPRIVPNMFDNTLLIQGTPEEYEQILKLLDQLDVSPRQVLIEAKIYEVNLQDAFSSGVSAFLQRRSSGGTGSNLLTGSYNTENNAGISLSAGTLVGQSRELLAFLTAQEDNRRAKVISAPTLIATDSIPASINVGDEVPTLTAQAVTGGIQAAGSSLFTQSIQNRQTGVTLNIMARVNPTGIVTLIINQEVSAPQAPAANAAIPSPSFSKRTVQTQVTVQDGDTIAIGGIINETDTFSTAGIPILHRIPGIGAAFGTKSRSKQRTELVVFMTPRVIYDTNQIAEASDELKSKFVRLKKMIEE
jgi:general secretion pathway protein D